MCHKQRWLLGRLGNKENISTSSSNSVSNLPFSRGTRVRHSLPEPSLNQRNGNRDRRFRPSWRTWNSVPEETTDTENEEIEGKKLLDYCPPPHTYRDRTYSEASEEAFDNSGEYVTFFHAHAYATRDMHNGHSDISNSYNQERTLSDIEKSYENRHENEIMRSDDYSAKTEHQKDQDSESGSSVSSWKQSSAIRRVQSFTGMAKARVQSLHHNISFKYSSHGDSKGKSKKSSINLPPSGSSLLPSAPKETSPVAPAAWLKQQEEHLANGGKKSGSLPRSFQPGTDNSSETTMTSGENTCRMRMRLDGSRSVYGERPFTIASDKPSHADFGDDLDYVVLDYSQYTGTEYYFQPQNNGYEHDTTTGCTNTPAVSMENVHAIHPELKIYHQAASKYATLKHLFFHMGSKIAGLKATIVSPTSQDPISSELSKGQEADNNTNKDDFKRSGSHSSIKSETELSPKLFTAKLAHSVAKAYSSVMRHKKKHEIKITDTPMSKKNEKVTLGTYKSESSLIGARMAQPLESEYSVPKYILSSKLLKDLRPDSLFSESSNATSSSDGDKTGNPESCFHGSKLDDGDDSVSEASDTSADSYYERTFDEIENALAQDVFRDSAIYSDPEDADFSTVEKPRLLIVNHIELEQPKVEDTAFTYQTNAEATSPTSPKIMCARKVNQAILDRLRILEENVKFQNEEASAIINTAPSKPYIQKRLDLDKWGNLVLNKDIEESETSSEHSASTVNTVMESGTKMNGNISSKSAPPKVKGWVKHVVDKFQGEGQV